MVVCIIAFATYASSYEDTVLQKLKDETYKLEIESRRLAIKKMQLDVQRQQIEYEDLLKQPVKPNGRPTGNLPFGIPE